MKNWLKGLLCVWAGIMLGGPNPAAAQDDTHKSRYRGKKVFYVNSYHTGYAWSDGIYASIRQTLKGTGVELRSFEMDTKRNPSEDYIRQTAMQAENRIDTFQPDVVITSDDNAAKFLIVPYYKNADLPFVFCGVNWDATDYGFPCRNVTGMIEVQLIDQILHTLKQYAKGNRIGFIKGDDLSARKEATFYERRFGISLEKRFVRNFKEWQSAYGQLQQEVDMLFVGNAASISGWDQQAARQLVEQATLIPTGNWDAWMQDYALVTYATRPSEQGEWAARTALEILAGRSPADTPNCRIP